MPTSKTKTPMETAPPQEVITNIPLSELHPFPNHPFQVRDDDAMKETAESIKEYGVLVPAIVRPVPDGGYEIVSGHRRKHASELAGLDTMPCIVRDMDNDAATIIMVDSNLQRESILPSERAMAYKMKMAQTVAYLQEHDLMDYAVLAEKTDAASIRFHELTEKIKSAETRMAEISVLRTQIINYAKTRDTYAAYRKAGYSKKFLSEHESEIALHKAAKRCFDEMGVTKLPTVKSLQAEYAALMAEKKEAYSDYRRAREEMKELLTAKANVDRILEKDADREYRESEEKAIL